jgi:hypothetical protein
MNLPLKRGTWIRTKIDGVRVRCSTVSRAEKSGREDRGTPPKTRGRAPRNPGDGAAVRAEGAVIRSIF